MQYQNSPTDGTKIIYAHHILVECSSEIYEMITQYSKKLT